MVERRYRHPGRKRLDDRKVLSGILFVLYTGIPWEFLPQELGFGSGMTCWRRLRDWQDSRGVAAAARGTAGRVARRRGAGLVQGGDRQLAPAGAEGRPETGPSPVDRARTGSEHHVITEGHGIPLAVSLTGGNRNDVTQLMPLIEAIQPVRNAGGRAARGSSQITSTPTTATATTSAAPRYGRQGITPVIARRGTEHGSGLGTYRWVIEQSTALLHWFRRLRIRWEIRDDIHEAFLSLACAIICWRRLTKLSFC